jgi:hypothetical protein
MGPFSQAVLVSSTFTMTTLASFLPNMGQGLHLKTYKVGGVYRKPVSGRKRAELIREVHDPTPKKWELRTPKGVKHDAAKIKRYDNNELMNVKAQH